MPPSRDRLSCVPCSTIRPSFITMIRSAAADRRQPVRDHDRCPPDHQPVKRILHQPFAFGVKRRGRFVEQQDRGIAQNGASDRNMRWRCPPESRAPAFAQDRYRDHAGSLRRNSAALAASAACPPERGIVACIPAAITQIIAARRPRRSPFPAAPSRSAFADFEAGSASGKRNAIDAHRAGFRIVEIAGSSGTGSSCPRRRGRPRLRFRPGSIARLNASSALTIGPRVG